MSRKSKPARAKCGANCAKKPRMHLEDQLCLYMDAEECQMVGFPAGTDWEDPVEFTGHQVELWINVQYKGPNHPEPPEFRWSIGTIVATCWKLSLEKFTIAIAKPSKTPAAADLDKILLNI
ncbi:hypothetical protein E2562_021101 [Oryza meyeriana var. granulata]|uniref:Uncharacterized protein n=1 Tax=Oryza meyeriana var. granulata TaxID=110450 RepID=A0A6G1BL33_9ORYZ|nr:hypothetical protein E2562_021101 [Oryza meyeriana var. granulata]